MREDRGFQPIPSLAGRGWKQGARRVLVVDDDERLMVAITQVLHDAGYEMRTSSDGDRAIQRLSMGTRPT